MTTVYKEIIQKRPGNFGQKPRKTEELKDFCQFPARLWTTAVNCVTIGKERGREYADIGGEFKQNRLSTTDGCVCPG
jgi:hypothetical protein